MRSHHNPCRRPRFMAMAAMGGLTVALLAGCGDSSTGTPSSTTSTSPSPSTSSTAPTPSPTATDPQSQAYGQAQDAYAKFLDTFNKVKEDGGSAPDRLGAVASGLALQQAQTNAALYRDRGWHQVTGATVVSTKGKSFTPDANGHAQVILESCQDIQKAEAVDKAGKPVTKKGTVKFLLYTVTLRSATTDVAGPWTVDEFRNAQVKSCG